MPAKSEKQYKFMQAVLHSKTNKKGVGPSKEVAKKFVEETPKEKRSLFMKSKSKKISSSRA